MKILILSTKMPWPPKDGGAIATLNLAVGLARNGASVTLLTMNTGKHYFPPEDIPEEINDLLKIHSVIVDTRIRPFSLLLNFLFSSYPYNAGRFISRAFKLELEKCLAETNYDIVQIEGPYLGYYKQFIGDGPLLSMRAHNVEHRIWRLRSGKERNPLKKIYFQSLARRIQKLEKSLLSNIDILVPISSADADEFTSMHRDLPLHICPTGMELEKYSTDNENKPPIPQKETDLRIFYIGALDWGPNREGLDWFFKTVWPSILNQWPWMVIHVAGRNSGIYFKDTPPPNVYPEGEVEDAISFYRQNNIMVVPLLSGSGIRIKIIEAMALKKVVICSSIAASGLGVTNGKHLFIAESADDYLKILGALLQDPLLVKETGHNARRFILENFDNFDISKKLISFYKSQLT